MVESPIYVQVSSLEFLGIVDRNCVDDEVDVINIINISDFKDITLLNYMDQPRSVLTRKLERSFIEEDFRGFRIKLVADLL